MRSTSCPAVRLNRKDASHQLLQPTHKTSTLRTVRFPSAPENLAAFYGAELPSANGLQQPLE